MSRFNNVVVGKFVGISLFVLRICFGDRIFRKKPNYQKSLSTFAGNQTV